MLVGGGELSGPSISVNGVTLRYSKHGPPVLDNVNIREESEFIEHFHWILPLPFHFEAILWYGFSFWYSPNLLLL